MNNQTKTQSIFVRFVENDLIEFLFIKTNYVFDNFISCLLQSFKFRKFRSTTIEVRRFIEKANLYIIVFDFF